MAKVTKGYLKIRTKEVKSISECIKNAYLNDELEEALFNEALNKLHTIVYYVRTYYTFNENMEYYFKGVEEKEAICIKNVYLSCLLDEFKSELNI